MSLFYNSRNPEQDPLRRIMWEGLRAQAMRDIWSAETWYRQALELNPRLTDAWCNLGAVLREQEKPEAALEATAKTLEIDPQHISAQCNLGIIKLDMRQPQEALDIFSALIQKAPDFYLAHFHLGGAYALLDRWEEALAAETEAVRRNPSFSLPYSNLGFVLLKLGRLEEAEGYFLRALALEPGQPSASWNLSYVRLLMNRWQEAWPTFHFRHQVREGLPSHRTFTQQEWQGEPFQGKKLLVWAEQGFGDTIHLMRLLPEVKERGGEVLFQVQPALLPLLQGITGADTLMGENEALPDFDLHVPLLSLPACLNLAPENVRDVVPYLQTSGTPSPALWDKIRESADTIRVGLAWTGNPAHQEQARRSISAAHFDCLQSIPGVRWFSLQVFSPGAPATSLPDSLAAVDLAPLLTDFSATAWSIQAMDLVISVDTVIAHLAGAMGIPTFLLLPFSPDWRWGQTGDATPWYPTLRIYRQPKPGDWESVLKNVVKDMKGEA